MQHGTERILDVVYKRAWIADRIKQLNDVLAQRTEQSTLALRRLTGPVTIEQRKSTRAKTSALR